MTTEKKLFNIIKKNLIEDVSKVKLYPYDPSIYSKEELEASRNYIKDLSAKGELLATSEEEIDNFSDKKILQLVNREFNGGLLKFMTSDTIEKYKNVINEKPTEDKPLNQEFSSVGGGGISGFTGPLGTSAKKYNRKKHHKKSARAFGGGQKTNVKKRKETWAKIGSVFPHLKYNIYDL